MKTINNISQSGIVLVKRPVYLIILVKMNRKFEETDTIQHIKYIMLVYAL